MLGAARVIDMPRTDKGAREWLKRSGWPQRHVECMGGKGGFRTEYQPPAEVLAAIHAFLEANPDFFGKDKTRASRAPAVSQPAPTPANTVQEPRPRYEVASPAPRSPETPGSNDKWMAIALDVAEHAIAMAEDRHVSTLDKVRTVNRLYGSIEWHQKLLGDMELTDLELINLVKPLASTLIDRQPHKPNNLTETDYHRIKERLREEKKKTH